MLFIYGLISAAEYEEIKFRSVNTCTPVVSNYNPQLSPIGAPSLNSKPHIRKVNVNDDPGDPFATPIGEIPIVFISLLCYFKIKNKNDLSN